MSTTLADAYLRLRPDTRVLGPELKSSAEKAGGDAGTAAGRSFGQNMKSAAAAIAKGVLVVGAVVAVGAKQAIDAASDLAETQSKVDVVFGKSAAAVKTWAANMADDFGQSQQAALDGAATFALYGKTAGKTGKDLFNFSTDLSGLASDMASFSNTTPEEAIAAIGAAMRGEADPIEKYGVLMNEASLKSIALKKGIIDTTKGALTPQQRVLAVQALLFEQLGKKGSGTLGDFERTSKGLANQQRILAAQTENFKAKLGSALLPIVTKLVTTLTTRLMPALNDLWTKHGPAITAWLDTAAGKFDGFAAKAGNIDWAKALGDAREIVAKLGPAIKDASDQMPGWSDTMSVAGVAVKFLADHLDTLAAALPYLAAGYVAVKVAQLASNVAMAASPVFRILEYSATKKQTAAIVAHTASLSAERAATIGSTVATGAGTAAENTGALARLRATAATVASTIASKAARAATIAWTGVQWLLNTALLANPIGLVVLAIIALIAIVVLAYQKNETFRKIVQAVWAGIKVAISAVGDWFVHTLWPSLKKAFDQLMSVSQTWYKICMSVWKGVWGVISAYWGFIRDYVFNPLKTFITKTIPDAFRAGVGLIGKWWSGLKAVASDPVDFMVNTVINKGIIGSLNWLAEKVGVKTRIPTVSYGGGGGSKSSGDKISGNTKNGDGYGQGDGDGIGSLLKSPVSWLSNRVGLGRLAARFGSNPYVGTVTGAARTGMGWAMGRVQALVGELFGGGGSVGAGGLRSGISGVLGALRGRFGDVPLISGLRPGAVTLTGNRSYHALGRAVDIAPVRAWAEFIRSTFGSRLKELITPWQDLNMLNGRGHEYTGAVWRQHNFAGGNAHIHAAMDRGGYLVPGWNEPIYNGTGRMEPITPPSTMDEAVEALFMILDVLRRLAPDIGREINGVGTTLRTALRKA